jgi:hypothetical protein
MRIGILVVAGLVLGILLTLAPKSPFVADEAQVYGMPLLPTEQAKLSAH